MVLSAVTNRPKPAASAASSENVYHGQGTLRRRRGNPAGLVLEGADGCGGRTGGSRTGGRSAQGDGSGGTIASKMGGAERSNFTNWPKASLPCCQQVRKTLAKICCVRAPVAVRLPPQVLRAIAMSRIARSAKLLVACNPGQRKKVNRCGCSWRKWLASR